MSFKETWKPRVDGVDDADSSAVNEIAEAVINNEENIENIDEKTYSKQEANTLFANALKGSASGEIVALKDVSPLEHNIGVRVSSKNLMNSDLFGNLFEKQEDGSYLSTEEIHADDKSQAEIDLPADIYTMSFYIKCPVGCNYRFMLIHEDGTKTDAYIVSTGDYVYKSITTNGKAIKRIGFSYNSPSNKVQFKELQIEKDTTATAYTPFVPDVGAVKVKAQGANIIDITEMLNSQLVDNGDGTYTLTKNGAGSLRFSNDCEINIPTGVYVKITNEIVDYSSDLFEFQFLDSNNNSSNTISFFPENRDGSQRFPMNVAKIRLLANFTLANGSYVKFKNLQIEYGTTATESEPHKEPVEYTVNPDGTVDGVKSIAPATTLTTDTEGVLIEVEYNKDANKVVATLEQRLAALEAAIISQ